MQRLQNYYQRLDGVHGAAMAATVVHEADNAAVEAATQTREFWQGRGFPLP